MRDVTGFVKAEGKKLMNGEGREILLRGVALGGWLLQEGYMWCWPAQGDRPRRIEKMMEDLIGEEKSKQFWNTYFERYTSEADIRQIAAEGFNSIRVPINSRHLFIERNPVCFNELHLKRIDRVIGWCKKYGLYVVLDLHGAPGGQTGTNIDDSENDKPELFVEEYNKYLTIEIWRMLAERYKDEWIVAGYDLLNEPLPEWFSEYNGQVMPLYRDIIKAIRKADRNHMIIIEGVHWATDWSIIDEKIDENLMLQFHKYWNNPDTESIQSFLDKGEELDVPVFMGEGGENNKEWLAGAFRLCEDHNISWNFWTWKKMDRNNSPCSVNMPEGWRLLAEFLEGGARPDEEIAEHILWQYLDNISFERCVYRTEIVNALFCRPPVRIPAIFYGYKGEGVSFRVNDPKYGQAGFRIKDGTDIRYVEGSRTKPNFEHMAGEPWGPDEWMYLQLGEGDWAAYEFRTDDTSEASVFSVHLCISAPDHPGKISISIDNTSLGIAGAEKELWETVRFESGLRLKPGRHHIVLKGERNAVRIQWLEVLPLG